MNLKHIIPELRSQIGYPIVSFAKAGTIVFNAEATDQFPFLQAGSKIAFFQDEDGDHDFFILPTINDSLIIREYKQKKSKRNMVCVQNKSLSDRIRSFYNASSGKGFKMKITIAGTEFNGNMYHAFMLIK